MVDRSNFNLSKKVWICCQKRLVNRLKTFFRSENLNNFYRLIYDFQYDSETHTKRDRDWFFGGAPSIAVTWRHVRQNYMGLMNRSSSQFNFIIKIIRKNTFKQKSDTCSLKIFVYEICFRVGKRNSKISGHRGSRNPKKTADRGV